MYVQGTLVECVPGMNCNAQIRCANVSNTSYASWQILLASLAAYFTTTDFIPAAAAIT